MGRIAFSAYFTDDTTGIFVSDFVAVPEPTTLALSLTALPLAYLNYRRRLV